jgi:general secretion pathway protein C
VALQFIGLGLAAYYLVRAFIAFLAPESLWQPPKTSPISNPVQPRVNAAQLNTDFDPFYREAAGEEIIEIGTGAPETTLNLKLVGRRAGENGSAILQTADGAQKSYNIGETIIDGVTLKAVKPDYVVLSQSGRVERLSMTRSGEAFLIRDGSQGGGAAVRSSAPSTIGTHSPAEGRAGQQPTLSTLLNEMSFVRLGRAGAVRGYRIRPKNGSEVLTQYGLAPGDIITQIGPIDLTSPSFNPSQLAPMLSGRKTVNVNLIRGQTAMNVSLGK